MASQRATTCKDRKAKKPVELSTRFRPRFLSDADQRQTVVKLIKRRVEQIKNETGCDTLIKEILIEELVFLTVMMATARVGALEGQPFDTGGHTQMLNAASGLASKLGINRKQVLGDDLNSYLAKKGKRSGE